MLRPTDQLSEQTCERLDAALALGARETWVDRNELGLPEPSPLGRWLCVLELPGSADSTYPGSADTSDVSGKGFYPMINSVVGPVVMWSGRRAVHAAGVGPPARPRRVISTGQCSCSNSAGDRLPSAEWIRIRLKNASM